MKIVFINILKKLFHKINFLLLKVFFNFKKNKSSNFYNDTKLNLSIINKTIEFHNNSKCNFKNLNYYRTLKFIKFIKKKNLKSVIDFGGGAGYHYFIARKNCLNLRWSIIENDKMVTLCKKKIKHRSLFFFNNINKVKNHDIFFSSCAINYLKNSEEVLKKITKKKIKYVYFTRTPFSIKKNINFKQYSLLSDNGPVKLKGEKNKIVCNENYLITTNKFESFFKKNFILIKKFVDEKKAFYSDGEYFNTYTYIFKRRN